MKQTITISLLLLLFSVQGFSQAEKVGPRFSIVLSPQISWMKSDHSKVSTSGNLSGYNFGIVYDNFFAPNYAFSTGITINTTGGKLKYQEEVEIEYGDTKETFPAGHTQTYRLKYIEIPLALKLRSSEFRRSHFYGQFGLSPMINIKTNDGDGNNLKEEVRPFDLSYHFGGGFEYGIGGENYLMLGVMYHNGFMDITKNASFSDKTILNRLVIQFGLIF